MWLLFTPNFWMLTIVCVFIFPLLKQSRFKWFFQFEENFQVRCRKFERKGCQHFFLWCYLWDFKIETSRLMYTYIHRYGTLRSVLLDSFHLDKIPSITETVGHRVWGYELLALINKTFWRWQHFVSPLMWIW